MSGQEIVAELKVGNLCFQAVQRGNSRQIRVTRMPGVKPVDSKRLAGAVTALRRGASRNSGATRRALELGMHILSGLATPAPRRRF